MEEIGLVWSPFTDSEGVVPCEADNCSRGAVGVLAQMEIRHSLDRVRTHSKNEWPNINITNGFSLITSLSKETVFETV